MPHDAPHADPTCPTRDDLAAFLRDEVAPSAREVISAHLLHCEVCSSTVRNLVGAPGLRNPDDRPPAPENPAAPDSRTTPGNVLPVTVTFAPRVLSGARPAVPERLGQYRLLEQIGRGGMGAVYRAEHVRLKKWVAVKVLPPDRLADPASVARFHREMEVVGRLDHPNIVRATDAGDAGGVHFLVMELIDGVTLGRLVHGRGPLPVPEACELIRQAALGLQHAHEHGLVHRDIKPQNLMLSARGEVKVLDLGLALLRGDRPAGEGLTAHGQVMGTPEYMAPEQAADSTRVDIRADVYALGCTLHFLLTGYPPGGPGEWAPRVGDRAGDSGVHAALDALLARLLAPNPADRPATPGDLVRELIPLAGGTDLTRLHDSWSRFAGASAGPTLAYLPGGDRSTGNGASPTRTVSRPRSRRRLFWALAAVVVLGGLAAVVVNEFSARRREPDTTPSPPDPPAPGPVQPPPKETDPRWVSLLSRPPTPRLWNAAGGSRWDHNAKNETLGVQAFQTGLLGLGVTTGRGFLLQIGFRQTQWAGGIGVYFGGKAGPGPDQFRCQVVHLRRSDPGFVLARSVCEVAPAGGVPGAGLNGFANWPLGRPLDNQEQLLEIEVKPQGRVFIRWNGDPCRDLTTEAANGRFTDADYQGEFGIYCLGTSAVVRTARVLQTP